MQIKTATLYLDVIGSISKRLINVTQDAFEKSWYEEELHVLRAAYYIQRSFNIKVKTGDLLNRNLKKSLRDKLIQVIIESIENSSSLDVIKKCEKIAYLLNYPTGDILIELSKNLENLGTLYNILEDICLKESSVKNKCLAVTIIIRNLGVTDPLYNMLECSGNVTLSVPQNDNTEVCRNSLKLAFDIIKKALIQEDDDGDFEACGELLKWLLSMYHLFQDKEFILQSPITCSKNYSLVTPSIGSFYAANEIFRWYSSLIGKVICLISIFFTFLLLNLV